MHLPKLKEGQVARVKVISVTNDGAFLDAGAERGIFMPFREMIGKPEADDIVWAKLYTDKSGRLAMSMKVSSEMKRAAKPAVGIKRGNKVTGSIFNIIDAGAFMFTEQHNIVFIPKKDIQRDLKVGEEITARVTFVHDDGRINASLRDQKEKALKSDSEKVLNYVKNNGSRINESISPEFIYEKMQLTKSAFKRAIGHLLKAGKLTKIGKDFITN